MTITVLFFAQAREYAGMTSATLDLPEPSRVSDALAALGHSHPSLERLWPHLAVALDGQLVGVDAPIRPGAELALLPPVSGG